MWGFAATSSRNILLEPTDSVHTHFVLGDELGSGFSGVVSKCRHRVSGQEYACKSIRKANLDGEEDYEDVRLEIAVMQKMSTHPCIVRLVAIYEDEDSVHLVMELCSGGDLFDEILRAGPFDEPDAARVLQQLAEGLRACHEAGIIHRDIKPENLMVVRPVNRQGSKLPTSSCDIDDSLPAGADVGRCQMKLADFGLAMFLGPFEEASGFAGSPYYVAPEILSETWYGRESDIWSLGVVLYVMLSGEFPFAGKTDQRLYNTIRQGKLNFSFAPWPSISPTAKSLIRSMLSLEPKERPTASALLLHPWMVRWCPNPLSAVAHEAHEDLVADISSALGVPFNLALLPTPETSPPLKSETHCSELNLNPETPSQSLPPKLSTPSPSVHPPPSPIPSHFQPRLETPSRKTIIHTPPPKTCYPLRPALDGAPATPSSPCPSSSFPSSSSSFSPRSVLHDFSSSFNSSFTSDWFATSSTRDPSSQACFEIYHPSQPPPAIPTLASAASCWALRAQKVCFGYGSPLFGSCLMSHKACRGEGDDGNTRIIPTCSPRPGGSGQLKIRPSRAKTAGGGPEAWNEVGLHVDDTIGTIPSLLEVYCQAGEGMEGLGDEVGCVGGKEMYDTIGGRPFSAAVFEAQERDFVDIKL